MSEKICDECETVAHCKQFGCIPKVMDAFNLFKQKNSKLGVNYYIRRIMKSKTPVEFLKNQADLVLFLNRRFGYEQEQYLEKYKELLSAFEPRPSKPHYSEEPPEI